jgi:hypothetical protein
LRRVLPLALAAALASCTSGTPEPTASASPTPSATTTQVSSSRSLLLAVTRKDEEGIDVYRVDDKRRAVRIGRIDPPVGHGPRYAVTVGGGLSPDVCVLWGEFPVTTDAGGAESAYCYPGGRGPGTPVARGGSFGTIALDPTGKHLFWSTVGEAEENEGGVVADYSLGTVAHQRHFDFDCERHLLAAAWAGPTRLVVHCTSGDNDDPGELSTFELGGATASAAPGRQVGDEEQLGTPAPWDGTTVLAVERQCDARCQEALKTSDVVGRQARVVRVDLRTGRVVEVVATAAAGRFVDVVTGGPHGVVYGTRPESSYSPLKAYLRWPGEKHGVPITGLPADVERLVAQP